VENLLQNMEHENGKRNEMETFISIQDESDDGSDCRR